MVVGKPGFPLTGHLRIDDDVERPENAQRLHRADAFVEPDLGGRQAQVVIAFAALAGGENRVPLAGELARNRCDSTDGPDLT